jgi:hypothetical protein
MAGEPIAPGQDPRVVMVFRRGCEGPVRLVCTKASAAEALEQAEAVMDLPVEEAGHQGYLALDTVVQGGRRSKAMFRWVDVDCLIVEEPAEVIPSAQVPR